MRGSFILDKQQREEVMLSVMQVPIVTHVSLPQCAATVSLERVFVLWRPPCAWLHYKDVYAQARSYGMRLLELEEVVPAVAMLFANKGVGVSAVCATHPLRIAGKKHLLVAHHTGSEVVVAPRPVHVAVGKTVTDSPAHWYGGNLWIFRE